MDPTTQAMPLQASLLGLPVELRYQVYSLVVGFEPNRLSPDKRVGIPAPRLPLTSLATSCKLLALETRSYLHSLAASERYAVLISSGSPNVLSIGTFQRAPCKVTELHTLKFVVNLTIDRFDTAFTSRWFYMMKTRLAFLFGARALSRTPKLQDVQIVINATKGKALVGSDAKFRYCVQEARPYLESLVSQLSSSIGRRTFRLAEINTHV